MKCPTDIVGIDTETHLIENRYEVPDGVVAGLCSGSDIQLVMWNHWDVYFPEFLKLNPTVKLAFFNGPFDMKVIGEDIFIPELEKDGRVMEIRANYRQTRIATHGWFPGSTTLASITKEIRRRSPGSISTRHQAYVFRTAGRIRSRKIRSTICVMTLLRLFCVVVRLTAFRQNRCKPEQAGCCLRSVAMECLSMFHMSVSRQPKSRRRWKRSQPN